MDIHVEISSTLFDRIKNNEINAIPLEFFDGLLYTDTLILHEVTRSNHNRTPEKSRTGAYISVKPLSILSSRDLQMFENQYLVSFRKVSIKMV